MRLISELENIIKEQGNESVTIYFEGLDENSKKEVMNKLRETLNVSEDDNYAIQKINEGLSKQPLFTLNIDEVIRQFDFDF